MNELVNDLRFAGRYGRTEFSEIMFGAANQIETLTRRLAEADAEIYRLRHDCGEAYQVIGCMSFDSENRRWTDDDEIRALDNLSAAANGMPRPHNDLLPWPKPPTHKAAQAAGGIEE